MSNNRKLLFVGLAILLALCALGFGIYLLFTTTGSNNTTPIDGGTLDGTGGTGGGGTLGTGIPQDGTAGTGSPTDNTPVTPTEEKLPVFRQLSGNPISGSVIVETPTSTMIRFIDRGTGHVYETYTNKGDSVRLSNMTIPKIYEALWFGPNKESVLLRFINESLNTTENYIGTLTKKPAKPNELEPKLEDSYSFVGKFIEKGIKDATVVRGSSELAYVLEGASASTIYTVADGKSTPKILGSIPATEWTLDFAAKDKLYLVSNPTGVFSGYAFSYSEKTKDTQKILSGTGLTTLASPTGKFILFSESTGASFSLKLLSTATGAVETMSVKTLPEKCIWVSESPASLYCGVPAQIYDGTYPDMWYKGLVRFHDILFRINVEFVTTSKIADHEVFKIPVDITQLTLTKNSGYLTFVNKIDGRLYGLSLKDL